MQNMKLNGRLIFFLLLVKCALSSDVEKNIPEETGCQRLWLQDIKICPWTCNRLPTQSSSGSKGSITQNSVKDANDKPAKCERGISDVDNYKNSLNLVTFMSVYVGNRIPKRIGAGRSGVVFSSFRIADNHPVALKHASKSTFKEWVKINGVAMPREVAIMFKLGNYSGITKLLDWSETDKEVILIMETSENYTDLTKYINEQGSLTEREASSIFNQTVSAVQYTHKRGVVHRDITSSNILFDRATGKIKLINFGLGEILHDQYYTNLAGTWMHNPPEMYNHGRYKAKPATVWSLGVVLYNMVCGELPFRSIEEIERGKLQFKCFMSDDLKNLTTMLLSPEPNLRLSLEKILDHPWIRQKFEVDRSHLNQHQNFLNLLGFDQNRNRLQVLGLDRNQNLNELGLGHNRNFFDKFELGQNQNILGGVGLNHKQNSVPWLRLAQNQNILGGLRLGRNRNEVGELGFGQNPIFSDKVDQNSHSVSPNILGGVGLNHNQNSVLWLRLARNQNILGGLRLGRNRNVVGELGFDQNPIFSDKVDQNSHSEPPIKNEL